MVLELDLPSGRTRQQESPALDYWNAQTTQAAKRWQVDPDVLYKQLYQESGFAPDVVSGQRKSTAGALGVAQFMPATAAQYGIDPLNPTEAIDGAARYMRDLLDMFGGDYRKALAGYNAGQGNVQRAITQGGDQWEGYLPAETKSYLGTILGANNLSSSASARSLPVYGPPNPATGQIGGMTPAAYGEAEDIVNRRKQAGQGLIETPTGEIRPAQNLREQARLIDYEAGRTSTAGFETAGDIGALAVGGTLGAGAALTGIPGAGIGGSAVAGLAGSAIANRILPQTDNPYLKVARDAAVLAPAFAVGPGGAISKTGQLAGTVAAPVAGQALGIPDVNLPVVGSLQAAIGGMAGGALSGIRRPSAAIMPEGADIPLKPKEVVADPKPIAERIRHITQEEANQVLADAAQAGAVTPEQASMLKLTKLVNDARKLRPKQREMFGQQRAERVGEYAGRLQGGTGRQAFEDARGALGGEYDRPQFEVPAFGEDEVNQLFDGIRTSAIRPLEKNNAANALSDALAGRIPQPAELRLLAKVYPELAEAISKKRSLGAKAYSEFIGLLGIPQTLQTMWDISGTLRQGSVLGYANPKEFGRSIQSQLDSLGSETKTQAIKREIEAKSFVTATGERAGYGFTDPEIGGHLWDIDPMAQAAERPAGYTGLNESNISRVMQKYIPGLRASSRAMATLLNDLGTQFYQREADDLWMLGERNPEKYKHLAQIANHAMGYGSVRAPDLIKGLNAFYSPRYLSSRIEVVLDPLRLAMAGDLNASRLAAKNMAAFIAVNAGAVQLASLATRGAIQTEWDSRSSDFGKAQYGNMRVDPWAGYAPMVRLISRLAQGEMKTEAGDVVDADRRKLIGDFARGRLGPIPGKLADAFGWKGSQPDQSELDAFIDTFTPFAVSTARELIQKGDIGPEAIAAGVGLGVLGTGVQAYEPSLGALREQKAQEQFKTGYDELLTSQKNEIDALPEVEKRRAELPPTEYQKAKAAALAEPIKRQEDAEAAFATGTLTKPLPDIWREVNASKRDRQAGLSAAFAKQFEKFDQGKFDKALDTYYNKLEKTGDGEVDWDKTDKAREDFLASQPEDVQLWINDYLGVKEQEKSPLYKEYKAYLGEKEKAGYFRDGIKTSEIKELDKQNPNLDVQGWRFRGGVEGKANPSLQSPQAVELALKLNLPNRNIKLEGLTRPINQDAKSKQGWDYAKAPIDDFTNEKPTGLVGRNREAEAQRLYKKPFAQIADQQKQAVDGNIRGKKREDSPELDAWLVWMGYHPTSGELKLHSKAAVTALNKIYDTYGRTPPFEGAKVGLVENAR